MSSIYTVTQVNSYIKNMFAQDFLLNRIQVRGEVSNCKYHSSGHIYFTLKDKSGTLAAVMFSRYRNGLSFELKEGQQVIVTGSIDVYEAAGKYQLYAKEIEPDGVGDLYEKFVKLRDELEEMGMFAAEYKQPIPRYASRIGIVTAPTGAAIQDIINISGRRNPYVQLILYPAQVQGEGAKESIVKGIKTLDALGVDVIIVGRGGGSIEDLWAFNEECVARAIFDCKTPVISAVGHETDVTIADYVADLRAPTPSAAAELAVYDLVQLEERLSGYIGSMEKIMKNVLEMRRYQTKQCLLKLQMHHPLKRLDENRQRLDDMADRIKLLTDQKLTERKHSLALLSGQLHALSPLNTLSRGFGFVTDEKGKSVSSVKDVEKGQSLNVRLSDGNIKTCIEDIDVL